MIKRQEDFAGYIAGRTTHAHNAASIRSYAAINGSGEDSFGGANEWQAITLEFQFPTVVTDQEVQVFLDKLKILVENEIFRNQIKVEQRSENV